MNKYLVTFKDGDTMEIAAEGFDDSGAAITFLTGWKVVEAFAKVIVESVVLVATIDEVGGDDEEENEEHTSSHETCQDCGGCIQEENILDVWAYVSKLTDEDEELCKLVINCAVLTEDGLFQLMEQEGLTVERVSNIVSAFDVYNTEF